MHPILPVIAALVVAGSVTEPPNIVLITVDALRPDRLGVMGYSAPLTPTLDSLAGAGVLFKNAFTSSAWTSPSLVSCLTGRHEPAHGVDTREKSLSAEVATLAGTLVAQGYHAPDICYLIGSPNYQNLGFEAFPQKSEFLTAGHDIMFRWLDSFAADHQPFFLYYHYRDIHQPYDPSPPFDSLFLPNRRPPDDPDALARFMTVRSALLLPEGRLSFAASDTGWVRGLYDGEVAEADVRFFRPLFDRLRHLGLAGNTLIVVTADHGEELLDHGNIGHASTSLTSTLYDEELRIPLILSGRGVPAGRSVDDLVQIVDIMPTLLHLVGLPVPEGVQGRTLLPLMEGNPAPAQPVFVSSVLGGYQATTQMQGIRLRAVRTESWKLIRRDEIATGSTRQLYDMSADPEELTDTAAAHPEVADSLEAVLESWLARCRALYRKPVWAGDDRRRGSATRPIVLSPQHGDSLRFDSCGGSLGVRLAPGNSGDMDIEYRVGQGPYHVEGTIPSPPDGVVFGPFTPAFWNTLARYNPWSFRVFPSGQPTLATEWSTFSLHPCDQ